MSGAGIHAATLAQPGLRSINSSPRAAARRAAASGSSSLRNVSGLPSGKPWLALITRIRHRVDFRLPLTPRRLSPMSSLRCQAGVLRFNSQSRTFLAVSGTAEGSIPRPQLAQLLAVARAAMLFTRQAVLRRAGIVGDQAGRAPILLRARGSGDIGSSPRLSLARRFGISYRDCIRRGHRPLWSSPSSSAAPRIRGRGWPGEPSESSIARSHPSASCIAVIDLRSGTTRYARRWCDRPTDRSAVQLASRTCRAFRSVFALGCRCPIR